MGDTKCHVLVVDDDERSREAVRALLESEGFAVTTVTDAKEAWATLLAGPRPDVIVLDLLLPGEDGWEFRARQKRDPRVADIPVVALSGVGKLIDVAHSLRKPLNAAELIAALTEAC